MRGPSNLEVAPTANLERVVVRRAGVSGPDQVTGSRRSTLGIIEEICSSGRIQNSPAVSEVRARIASVECCVNGKRFQDRARGVRAAVEAQELGRWMNISHDGDRVVRWDERGDSYPFTVDYSDSSMQDLITRAESADPKAELVLQTGAYGCSIPQIDQMVDIALSVDGVVGAQISGAGLGGCIMVLVHKDTRDQVEKAMVKHYYDPADLEPDFFACSPVAGSAPISS